MALAVTTTAAAAFTGGVVTTCFSQGLPLDKKKFKMLVLRGLQGTIFTLASLCISLIASRYGYAYSRGTLDERDQQALYAALIAPVLCGTLITTAAKALPNRLGTPREALTNFAVSSALGYLSFLHFSKN